MAKSDRTSGIIERAVDVLIVEDDAEARDLCASFLAQHACIVRTAEDGRAAARELRARAPDVIVIALNRGDGRTRVALAESIRDDERTSGVALVAMTSAVEPHAEALRLFDAYLRKPIDERLLVDLVHQLAAATRTERHRGAAGR